MPKVSIVVPFLNAGTFLLDAIASVQAQTMADWELILIDDGSTDTSYSLAVAAAAADDRIHLLPAPESGRCGAAAARNRGLEVARGEFVTFLDADDLFEPVMLETTLNCASMHPEAAAVVGPTHWWHPGNETADWTEPPYGSVDRVHAPPALLVGVLLLQCGQVPCVGSVLIRRSAIEQTGGFEEGLSLYEDQALLAKLFLRFPVVSTPVCLLHYRQHAASTSSKAAAAGLYARNEPHPARLDFIRWIESEIARSGLGSRKIRRALRIARSPYAGHRPQERFDRALLTISRRFGGLRGRVYRRLVDLH